MQKIVKHNCQELLQSVPFFENAPEVFITAVLTRLKFELFLPEEFIVRQGFKGDRMYFIQRGVVEVITADGNVVTHLSEGAHFGEICLLTDDRRVATIRATTTCDLFSLSKQNFSELLEEFPEMRPFFEAIARNRLGKIGQLPDDDACDSASECRSRIRFTGDAGKFSPNTYRSLCNIDEEEMTPGVVRGGKSGQEGGGKTEKSASYKSLTLTRSRPSVSSTPRNLRDEEYAQINPHFVSGGEDT